MQIVVKRFIIVETRNALELIRLNRLPCFTPMAQLCQEPKARIYVSLFTAAPLRTYVLELSVIRSLQLDPNIPIMVLPGTA